MYYFTSDVSLNRKWSSLLIRSHCKPTDTMREPAIKISPDQFTGLGMSKKCRNFAPSFFIALNKRYKLNRDNTLRDRDSNPDYQLAIAQFPSRSVAQATSVLTRELEMRTGNSSSECQISGEGKFWTLQQQEFLALSVMDMMSSSAWK